MLIIWIIAGLLAASVVLPGCFIAGMLFEESGESMGRRQAWRLALLVVAWPWVVGRGLKKS